MTPDPVPVADYVAQMQDAVSDVLDHIHDVNTYVDTLLAHWAWVAKTIDAATGQRLIDGRDDA